MPQESVDWTRNTISTTSTSPTSPKCGGAVLNGGMRLVFP